MPGIVGLITKAPRERAERQLQRMLSTISHDSSYTTGTWIDESAGVYVGWALHAGSFCDGMPLVNEQRDVVLVFSGEEYPDPGIVATLKRQGHALDSAPASYLVHLCEADPMFPAGLNGRFQGLSIDRRVGKATLFNDRSGLHRVYYHQSDNAFYFAVEAKAILAVALSSAGSIPGAWASICRADVSSRTERCSEGISVLPPAPPGTFGMAALEQKKSVFLSQRVGTAGSA